MATKTWEFTQSLNVDGKVYAAGDTVAESDIPAGSFQSLKRLKQVKEHKEVPLDLVVGSNVTITTSPAKAIPQTAGKAVSPPLPAINPPTHVPAHTLPHAPAHTSAFPPLHTPAHAPAPAPSHAKEPDEDDKKNPKRNK